MIDKIVTSCCSVDNGFIYIGLKNNDNQGKPRDFENFIVIDKKGIVIVDSANMDSDGCSVLDVFNQDEVINDKFVGVCDDCVKETQITIYFSDGTVFQPTKTKEAFLKLLEELKGELK